MPPRMVVVAGPPGSGKSSAFPVSGFGLSCFNADDRACELNGGSYVAIPKSIRTIVNREFEAFVLDSTKNRSSFAIETTLRTAITFEQAARAKAAGFRTEMRYLALRDFSLHLERIKARADSGGHSASETVLQATYRASLDNFAIAITQMDEIWAYDNSAVGGPPRLVLEAANGSIRFLSSDPPNWLITALDAPL